MSEATPTTPEHDSNVPLHSPPTSPQRPRGILKNASQNNITAAKLTWDEENLAATEIGKDSLMKIDEPKTPFVRYNAELDNENEGDIPSLELDNSAPVSPFGASFHATTAENTAANAARLSSSSPSSPSGSRPVIRSRSSDRNSRRPSISTTRSGSSSRSTSFNLPPDDLGRTEFREGGLGLVRGEDDVLDDEEVLDEESLAKRAEFRKLRGRHYSNEAEAMKRAQVLMAAEDDEDGDGDAAMHDGHTNGIPPVPAVPNGVHH